MKKTKQEWMVDLEDITASGFKYSSNLFLLAMTVGTSLYFLLNLFNGEVGLAIGFLLVTVIFAVLYYLSRKTLFVVTFAGGWIAVNASQYGVENAHRFNKVLRYEKEKRMEQLRR